MQVVLGNAALVTEKVHPTKFCQFKFFVVQVSVVNEELFGMESAVLQTRGSTATKTVKVSQLQ